MRFTAPPGQRLTSVGVSLPRALRIDRKRARKAMTVLAGGHKVARPTLHLAGAAVTVGGCRRAGRARWRSASTAAPCASRGAYAPARP